MFLATKAAGRGNFLEFTIKLWWFQVPQEFTPSDVPCSTLQFLGYNCGIAWLDAQCHVHQLTFHPSLKHHT